MKADIVKQYYKDLETGVEMSFSKYRLYGWTVMFPQTNEGDAFLFEGNIPWSTLSEEEQAVVDAYYKVLDEILEEEYEQDK